MLGPILSGFRRLGGEEITVAAPAEPIQPVQGQEFASAVAAGAACRAGATPGSLRRGTTFGGISQPNQTNQPKPISQLEPELRGVTCVYCVLSFFVCLCFC